VLDAIDYGVAHAGDISELKQVFRDYLGWDPDVPVPAIITPFQPLDYPPRVRIVWPPDFDPDELRLQIFMSSVPKNKALVAKASPQPGQQSKPEVAQADPRPRDHAGKPLEIVLRIPSFKAAHESRYRGLLGRLIHDSGYDRERNAQSGDWDRAMHPDSGHGMDRRVYELGFRMGLEERRVLRPNWSRDERYMDMQVDHMIELQVVPMNEWEIWDNFDTNYELLDKAANTTSGTILKNNIIRERWRLTDATGDPSWLTRPLLFTRVEADTGPGGHRWVKDEIRRGDHLRALREHQGER
jgi:hypothetical protein